MSRVLVVDDDLQVLEVVGEMLRLEGYEVEVARNGREALEQFKARRCDLVITDLIMPDKEGLETIAELRALDKEVPIIAMSGGGRIGPGDYLQTAGFIGANSTLAKPFARSELILAVSRLLSAERSDQDEETDATSGGSARLPRRRR